MSSRPGASGETPDFQQTHVLLRLGEPGDGEGRANPWAYGTSAILNGGLMTLLVLASLRIVGPPPAKAPPAPHFDLSQIHLMAPPSADAARGGGGGGNHDLIDAITGRNPRQELAPLMPPMVPLLNDPRLVLQPAVAVPPDVKLPDNPLPEIGVHISANVRLVSSGPGTRFGIGTGDHGGDGPGNGPGHGPGLDGGAGDSVYRPGVGGVSNPVPVLTPEAEFSDEARRTKFQGAVMVAIIVDARGNPQNARIVRSLGMGLDEKALEAVRRYRFKPAMKNGRPVPVMITVEVNFRLY